MLILSIESSCDETSAAVVEIPEKYSLTAQHLKSKHTSSTAELFPK